MSRSASTSSATVTAISTSRVKRTSDRTETASPPTRAKRRFRSESSFAMAANARSGAGSAILREPSHQHVLDFRFGSRGKPMPEGGPLQADPSPHHLQGLGELFGG